MDTIFVNSKKRRLSNKVNLKQTDKYRTLKNFSI